MSCKTCGRRHLIVQSLAMIALSAAGSSCLETATKMKDAVSASTASPTPSAATAATSAKAVRIIFKSSVDGSFDAAPANGTKPLADQGHPAVRVFNPDGTLLADGTSATTWPTWLKSVEIGISGTDNTSATNDPCARFADLANDGTAMCDFDGDGGVTTGPVKCGSSPNYYRVSEYDCVLTGTTAGGTGGAADGVYIRTTFDRSTANLGAGENILAVLEYSASAKNQPPANPASCFTAGSFNLSGQNCADMVWQIFLKHSATEVVQPYLMLVPPAISYIDKTKNTGGGGISTKQFFLPFAGDSTLSVMQISRIKGPNAQNAINECNGKAGPGYSANCVGMVFYTLTFYRI